MVSRSSLTAALTACPPLLPARLVVVGCQDPVEAAPGAGGLAFGAQPAGDVDHLAGHAHRPVGRAEQPVEGDGPAAAAGASGPLGGEAQRVKLARELSKRDTGSTLYILDEPTTGLHFHDIQQLLDVLHRLRDHGNTIIVIEHNLDVIKTADWIVDMGPEGGDKGGTVVTVGTPEQVAAAPNSYTGQFLKPLLERQRKNERHSKSSNSPHNS